MIFGPVDVADAAGAVLVHTLRAGPRVLKKGRALTELDVRDLAAAGHSRVVVARLEPDDVGEDAAAAAVAAAVAGDGVHVERAHTGRANLHAAAAGLLRADRAAIDRLNAIDEAITLATIAGEAPVRAGELIATVKIIPFAAPAAVVEAAVAAAARAITVAPWRPRRAGLVLTTVDGTAGRLLDRAAAAQRERMTGCGGALVRELRVAHDEAAVAGALAALAADRLDPILALGASAIMDRRDVIPAALVRAGGAVIRLGMPVDPGNLLMLGRLGAATVIGVPGCARSRKRSGFDAVLERACAGVPIAAADLGALGVGGLLEEPAARPWPRAGDRSEADDAGALRIAALVLAAGRGARMGGGKLTADLDGAPLVRHPVQAALASRARPVVVVTGADADGVRAALAGLDVVLVHNPDHALGMSTSLRAGIAALADRDVDGALVLLGDMPRITAAHLDALAAAFDPDVDATIVVPTCARKRGNPVLWGRRHFAAIGELTGDVGARALIERHPDQVRLLALDDPAILVDVDTPEALAAARAAGPAGAGGPASGT
jgi:molybdenum cofactor cytidylyltransferase